MSEAHRRRKNPELVRAALIDSAGRLALEQGLASVSVEAVAAAAGVTKGGFFHHFPSKQALIDAVFEHLLADLDAAIDRQMASDPEPQGRFMRAYVELAFGADDREAARAALWISTITDEKLCATWGAWFARRLKRHGEDERGLDLELARFAADGVWFGRLANITPENGTALRDKLISMTRSQNGPSPAAAL